MALVISACLILAGVIHLLPLPGVLGADWLNRLYGVAPGDPDMLIMMRHRALMFGVLGAVMIGAAFRPEWQGLAVAAGLVSAAGFLALAWQTGGYSRAIGRVVAADLLAVAALCAAAVMLAWR